MSPSKESLECVRCNRKLTASGSHGALACRTCAGEFCRRETFDALVKGAVGTSGGGAYVRPALSISEPVRYVRCPVCRDLMSRRNFGESSGVVVDICTPHGVWFDRGELSQVLSFCTSGNLARAVADAAARDGTCRRMDAALGTGALAKARSESDSVVNAVDVAGLCVELVALFFE